MRGGKEEDSPVKGASSSLLFYSPFFSFCFLLYMLIITKLRKALLPFIINWHQPPPSHLVTHPSPIYTHTHTHRRRTHCVLLLSINYPLGLLSLYTRAPKHWFCIELLLLYWPLIIDAACSWSLQNARLFFFLV